MGAPAWRVSHMKILVPLVLALVTLTARAAEPPPTWLSAYLTNGMLSLSDLSWAGSRFAGSSAEHHQWGDAMHWVSQTKRERTAEVRKALSAAGASTERLAEDCYDDDLCQMLARMERSAHS